MKCGYNVEIYNVNELNFPWGKKLLPIFPLIYCEICKVRSDNSNPEVNYAPKILKTLNTNQF